MRGRYQDTYEDEDTPSIYSRPDFSPNLSDGDRESQTNDPYNPPSSMLDLGDDARLSFTSEGFDNQVSRDEDSSEYVARMSYLGPKMRVHSRAPWELEDGQVAEEDESDNKLGEFASGYPFSSVNVSNVVFPTRPSYSNRPSVESSRSHIPSKKSFETINSQTYPRGTIYSLAQDNTSMVSLSKIPVRLGPKETLRNKFSLGRLRSEPNQKPTNQSIPNPPVRPLADGPPLTSSDKPIFSYDTVPRPIGGHMNQNGKGFIHPYANPDLVISYAEDRQHPTSSSLASLDVRKANPTDSILPDPKMRPFVSSTLVNERSLSTRSCASSIHTKNISRPVAVNSSPQRFNVLNENPGSYPSALSILPGWTERDTPPSFSLISLEEARAQRTRSSTFNASSSPTSSTASNFSNQLSPEDKASNNADIVPDSSLIRSLTSKARGRSISAGSKAKTKKLYSAVGQVKSNERSDLEPIFTTHGGLAINKTLKPKKSGFMRLFNNGSKVQEKVESDNHPPVPILPESDNGFHNSWAPISLVRHIPVPSHSPSLFEVTNVQRTSLEQTTPDTTTSSPKYNPLVLPTCFSTSLAIEPTNRALGPPCAHEHPPRSAPPEVSEFPALKLRPISTLFSAQFGDHILTSTLNSSQEPNELEKQNSTSSSPGFMSPVSAVSFNHVRKGQSIPEEDVIAILQEQFESAKKVWQKHIWELELQVRNLKAELEDSKLKSKSKDDCCPGCGRV